MYSTWTDILVVMQLRVKCQLLTKDLQREPKKIILRWCGLDGRRLPGSYQRTNEWKNAVFDEFSELFNLK